MGWDEALEHSVDDNAQKVSIQYRLDRSETSQDLSSAALSYTTATASKFEICQVLVHASENITETVNVYFNSVTGANYDTLIGTVDFDGNADVGLIAGDNMLGAKFDTSDEVTVTCTDTNGTGTIYVTIIVSLLT